MRFNHRFFSILIRSFFVAPSLYSFAFINNSGSHSSSPKTKPLNEILHIYLLKYKIIIHKASQTSKP